MSSMLSGEGSRREQNCANHDGMRLELEHRPFYTLGVVRCAEGRRNSGRVLFSSSITKDERTSAWVSVAMLGHAMAVNFNN